MKRKLLKLKMEIGTEFFKRKPCPKRLQTLIDDYTKNLRIYYKTVKEVRRKSDE